MEIQLLQILNIKFHLFKCVSLLNEVLWSMVAEILLQQKFLILYLIPIKCLRDMKSNRDYYNSL